MKRINVFVDAVDLEPWRGVSVAQMFDGTVALYDGRPVIMGATADGQTPCVVGHGLVPAIIANAGPGHDEPILVLSSPTPELVAKRGEPGFIFDLRAVLS